MIEDHSKPGDVELGWARTLGEGAGCNTNDKAGEGESTEWHGSLQGGLMPLRESLWSSFLRR